MIDGHYLGVVVKQVSTVLLTELNDRFSEINIFLMCSLEALIPTSNEFLLCTFIKPFLLHYEIDEDSFIKEAKTAKSISNSKSTIPLHFMKCIANFQKYLHVSHNSPLLA